MSIARTLYSFKLTEGPISNDEASNPAAQVARGAMPLEQLLSDTLGNLGRLFIEQNPGSDAGDFVRQMLEPLKDMRVSGDFASWQMSEAENRGSSAVTKDSAFATAVLYFVQSDRALSRLGKSYAWRYLAEAQYWLGIARALTDRHEVVGQVAEAATKLNAAVGGIARAKKTLGATKEYAFRLARERKPEGSLWKSRRRAAFLIAKDVVEYSKKGGSPLTGLNPEDTINDWLKSMPDAGELFRAKPSRKKT